MASNAKIASTKHEERGTEEEPEMIIKWFEEVAENAGAVQTETLQSVLELNRGAEYLTKWLGNELLGHEELDGAALESLYTSLVPLCSHADIDPYVSRIADGDSSPLLTSHPITHLSLSSGTTDGRQKYLPFTRHSAQTTLEIFRIAAAYRSRVYPVRRGGKILDMIYSSKQLKTKGGLTAGTATTHYFASQEFKIKQEKTQSYSCSPQEVISSGDYKQSTYCHLLLGLVFSEDVEIIASTFAYSTLQALTALETLWRGICIDIAQGSLSEGITIPSVRESVLRLLVPNPSLGAQIRAKCEALESLNWRGTIKMLWPNCKYVYSIMTGSMETYTEKLKHYAGDLPLVCADYGSTEGWIGVNVDPALPPDQACFAVVPTFSYYEFIPLRPKHTSNNAEEDYSSLFIGNDNFIEDEPVPLSRVKVGQQYEVVLTNETGLYRYRLGDIVQVVGWHKNTPKLKFTCRRKLILTINIDKNTERDVQLAVERGREVLVRQQGELVDFTSRAEVASQPGHYVIYWEIKGDVAEEALEECCTEMDRAFVDPGYVGSRKAGSIGPLELCIVDNGTFQKALDQYLANGAAAALSQFKTPRCVTNPDLLRILDSSTVKRLYSTAYNINH